MMMYTCFREGQKKKFESCFGQKKIVGNKTETFMNILCRKA